MLNYIFEINAENIALATIEEIMSYVNYFLEIYNYK